MITSLIVKLGFEQKFKFDSRVGDLRGWTYERFQLNSRIDVRRVLSSLFELTIYDRMRKISLSAEFSVERYSRSHQVVFIKSFSSSRSHQVVLIKSSSSSRSHQVVLIIIIKSSHHDRPYQAHLSSSFINLIYQDHLSSLSIMSRSLVTIACHDCLSLVTIACHEGLIGGLDRWAW